MLALLILAAAAALIVKANRPAGDRVGSPPAVFAQLSSGALTASGHYASLTQIGGHLIVSGGPGGYPLNVSGATTSLRGGRATGRCTAATVAPDSVRLEPARHANCGDPALYGLHAMPIISFERSTGAPAMDEVRIAVADSAARDGYRLGPVLMRYVECSDCGAQWIIGDHALWINGPFAHSHLRSGEFQGEVLRVSTSTGRVLQRFAVPQLLRSLLAVNQDGLWIAPSIETGVPGRHLRPRVQRAYSSLYLLAPGARHANAVLDVGEGISWLAASEQRVYLEESSHGTDRMVTFAGTSAQHRREGPRQRVGSSVDLEIGEGTTPYTADPGSGVEGVISPNNTHQAVVSYSIRTLTERVLVTTPQPDAYDEQPDAAAIGGSLYFLDAQISLAGNPIPGQLYRLHTG